MKLIFTREEVAAALGQTTGDFDILRPSLEAEGFPKPVRGLSLCWSIMDVINWVNRDTVAHMGKEGMGSCN
ncbi:MAG: hypothetical protein H7X89_11085 [Rhizobiales bacterium]|nr:hypothetical protein [Hyphomicrobiales bacterium]